MQTIIGVDLDNTLVCYDELFHRVACEEGLIEPSIPKSKEGVRDAIRLLPDGERKWTRLQAIVYGPRMGGAALFEGIGDFFRDCAAAAIPVFIVSHKTRFAPLDGTQADLRQAALGWMEAKGFFEPDGFGISPASVYFEATRAEKISRIRELRCTHFVDDLPEVFSESDFPKEITRLLFAPHGTIAGTSEFRAFKSWAEIDRFFFHEQ